MKNILITIFTITFLSITTFAEELKFAVMGDAGKWNSNTQMLLNSMTKMNIKQLIMPGDNLYKGTYEQQWNPWKKAGFTFDIVAIGNHNESYAKEIKFFEMPGEFFAKEYANGDLLYLILNSDNTKNVDQQMTWLKAQLENSRAQQIYLVYHHPSFTVAMHKWTEKKAFQLKLRQVVRTYREKVTALIVGHDHIASLMHFYNLPVIISGSTQSPRNETPVNNVQQGIPVTTAIHLDSEPYWIMQNAASTVLAADTSEFFFIRGKDSKIICKALIKTGHSATHQCERM